jgi:structural maintenance of chromosome 2
VSQKLNTATQLAPAGKVNLALSLIGYPEEVSNAMAFVFGDTLICADADTAKLVTFSPQVGGARSVTLDGDVYDPSGTLSGGARPGGGGTLLVRVQALRAAEERVVHAEATLGKVEQVFGVSREGGGARERWRVLKRELEIKEHEMRLLEEQVMGSNAVRVRPSPLSSF